MNYELLVGLRYTRARRRNRFIGINSLVSMIGIMVGVWALIVVLSVMNGFQKEVRTRILGVASHGLVTPAGVIPRLKQFTLVGVFEAGIADADAALALVHLQDAQTLYQLGTNVTGVRLKLDDIFAARTVARELLPSLPQDIYAQDWTRTHANFFRAVEIEKRMMFIILTLIVLVAAINIISTLVVAVKDK